MPLALGVAIGIPFTQKRVDQNPIINFNYIQQDLSDFVQQDGVSVYLIQP